jgi:tripartite-type tricarboxylate transporter receptor subunit TctC
MTLRTGIVVRLAFIALALAGCNESALAQSWPAKPVKVIISQPPGTAPDIITRLLTDQLAKSLGQPFIVENRAGAQNIVGAQAAARSAPDGYTFFVATAAALVTNPVTFKSLPYDPAKDFTPVSMVGKGPFLLVANPKVPASNLRELVNLDKSKPGALKLANEGPKSFGGMIAAWLNKVAGTQILLVPYNVNSQGIQDTLGGTTELGMQAVPAVASFVKRGDLKGIAVTSAQRLPGLESIPAVAETFPGFEATGWFIMVAPTGTPAGVVRRMNAEMDRVLKDPAINSRMRELGIFSEGAGTPASVDAFVRTERATWTRIVREIGIEPE